MAAGVETGIDLKHSKHLTLFLHSIIPYRGLYKQKKLSVQTGSEAVPSLVFSSDSYYWKPHPNILTPCG